MITSDKVLGLPERVAGRLFVTLKSRPILALLFVATATLSVAPRVGAETFPGSLKQIGSWTLVANASSRAFHSCSMRRVQSDGFAIFIGLSAGDVPYFGTSAPRWDLQARRTYPLSLTVGARPFTFNAVAMSNDTLSVDAAPEFFAALQSGQTLGITANQRRFAMDIEGIEAAMAGLRECVANYKSRTVPIARAPSGFPPESRLRAAAEASTLSRLRDRGFVVKNFALPVYPASSKLAQEEGLAYVKVRFPAEGGSPDVITLEHSSGYPALDQAAIDSMKEMRIEPYLKDGKPTAISIVLPVQFRLIDR